jgi:hypothetical protein
LDYGLRTNSVGLWGGEILTLSNRDQVELTPLAMFDNTRPLMDLVNPRPLAQHQIPLVIFK